VTKYFGYLDKAEVTLNAILGYDPTLPHWVTTVALDVIGLHLRAKYRRIERQLITTVRDSMRFLS